MTVFPLLPGEYEDGVNSGWTPVVTAQEQHAYMGYPFSQDQMPAVQDVLDSLTAELQRYLHVDLAVNTWTEIYTVPMAAPDYFTGVQSFGASGLQDYWNDFGVSNLGLGMATGPIELNHAPVRQYLDLQVWVPYPTGASAAPYPGQLYNPDVNGGGDDPTLTVTASPYPGTAGVFNGASGTWLDYGTSMLPPPPGDLPQFLWGTTVQVTYAAGYYGNLMPDVRGVIRRAAARELTNRLDDAVGMRGPLSSERLPDGPGPAQTTPGFMPQELARLSRMRRRVIV